jgi:NAD(P)-dependent dehydrogenase (short-subunit alcohol dehydrogenase family)
VNEFENKVAIVTGTTGIGRAIAKRLVSGGASVTACGIDEAANRELGELQTAVFHPLPNTPSKASLPPFTGESVTYVSGTMCYLCLRPLTPNLVPLQLR